MSRIVILTKNILAELGLQAQLQQMNYEVLTSSSLYTQLCYQMSVEAELSSFHLFIFSETLTDEEVRVALPLLIASGKPIVQRVDVLTPEEEQAEWQQAENFHFVEIDLGSRQFKQKLEELINQEIDTLDQQEYHFQEEVEQIIQEPTSLLKKISFTKIELKILEILYAAKGQLVTKEVLCEEIWHQPLTKSRVVQIYTAIGRIKDKLQGLHSHTAFIGTQRGVGYFLTPAFYDNFILDLPVYKVK